MYRTTDAGKTWTHIGLEDAGQIGRIRVHPRNEDLVYAAVLGNMFGANEERGIFRSKDGGATWEKVLYISDRTGFVDLAMDANNPRVLYAAAWRAERKPWTIISGSEEGGLWKSTDGGDNWTKLAGGLPEGLIGRIGVAVSPADSNRVWALVEAPDDKGGVYRSDDAGESWRRINSQANLRQRPWYYTHIYADPKDADTVYALNTGFYKSVDGGRTFPTSFRVPHGDNHDLWLNPEDPNNMINANDGGANVSFDAGASWSWQMNQPTAELYRVEVDDQWPYRVYGPQQDNSTISVPSMGFASWNRMPPEWYSVGGCESGHIAVDPRDPDIVYAGCYGGSISRINRKTGESREIIAYPQLQLGQAPRDLKYRYQWNAPIALSPHDPNILYHTSQVVHRSTDEGQSWTAISPDLTTDNQEQQDYSGGPISHDSTGVEVYNTIFAFEESQHRKGELWAGTDDGRVHKSTDGGGNWNDATPRDMPEGGTVNVIEISEHDPDRIFVAVYRYRENDFKPYIFRTNNGGRRWDLLTDGTNGIPATNFTRAIREDPDRRGLLYAGTEFGLYISFDDGEHWQKFMSELPVTPVTDMQVHRKDLVVATQGRSFWILRDLSPLHQLTDEVQTADMWLFEPRVAYRGGFFGRANVFFHAASVPEQPVKLEFMDGDELIRSVEWKPGQEDSDEGGGGRRGGFGRFGGGGGRLQVEEGLNRFSWNLRHESPERPRGVVHWGGSPGIPVPPGTYQVRMSSGDWSQTQDVVIERWPTIETTQADFEQQYAMSKTIQERLDRIYSTITEIRDIKSQVGDVTGRLRKLGIKDKELTDASKALNDKLKSVEERLTQVKSKSGQDPLNFPPMIDNQYVELFSYVVGGDYKPPAGAQERLADLDPQLHEILMDYDAAKGDIAAFNDMVRDKEIPAISSPKEETEETPSEAGGRP